MKAMLVMLLVAAFLPPASAMTRGVTCGMATLENVDVLAEFVPQATVTTARARHRKPGERDWFAYTSPGTRLSKRYLVTVRLDDVLYTGESSGDGFWTFNPTRLVINDAIYACVTKDRLRLTRPDGRDYTPRIVRVIRQVEPPSGDQSER